MPSGLLPGLTPASMPEFRYVAPKSIEETVSILGSYGSRAKIIAGGSDLLHQLKRGVMATPPEVVVDIKGVDGLSGLEFDPKAGLTIGCLVTLATIEDSVAVGERYPVLTGAADYISSRQVRNVATVGGALSQQVWCWFLRNGLPCWRAGGQVCYAKEPGADNRYYTSVMGGSDCYSVHPSDLAVALFALDASVKVAGPSGFRTMTIGDFLPGNVWVEGRLQSHILSSRDLLVSVVVPPPLPGTRSVFLKTRVRNAFDFAIASVALVVTTAGGIVNSCRVVFGGLAPAPYRDLAVEEALVGRPLSSLDPEGAAGRALLASTPIGNNAYKVDVAKGLLREAIVGLAGP